MRKLRITAVALSLIFVLSVAISAANVVPPLSGE